MLLDVTQTSTRRRRKAPSTIIASGRIHFWHGGSLWIGSGGGLSDWHAHHAHQLALALNGDFRFRSRAGGPWTVFEAAIVPSHCPHQFKLDGAAVAHLFVEPESTEGRLLSGRFGALGISPLPQPEARACAGVLHDALRANADAHAMRALARAALARLAGTTDATSPARPSESAPRAGTPMSVPREVDPRIARALAYIGSRVRAPLSLADAAAAATLSPSRFRHLFVQETGASFRAYLLWLRINLAIEAVMAGASWTQAAHEAGFADSAHLSRTHKRMFGIEPTALRQR